jgi:hypothetical protein
MIAVGGRGKGDSATGAERSADWFQLFPASLAEHGLTVWYIASAAGNAGWREQEIKQSFNYTHGKLSGLYYTSEAVKGRSVVISFTIDRPATGT